MKYIAVVALIVAIFLTGLGIGYKISNANQLKANDKALQDALTHVQTMNKLNTELSAANATLQAKVEAKNTSITTQSPKERIVYVHIKPTAANPTPAPTAITAAVFVTVGAIRLWNSSFGVSESPSPASGDTADTGDIPSSITISDYEIATTKNAVGCFNNQQTVILLWRYIHGLQAAGFVEKN